MELFFLSPKRCFLATEKMRIWLLNILKEIGFVLPIGGNTKNVVLFNPKCDGSEALAPDPALPCRRIAVYHRLLETESRRGGVRCRADGWQ